jgi:nicotinamide riboside transporter PnuC
MKDQKTHMALRLLLFVALGIILLPSVNGQEPPVEDEKPCLYYAYTTSQEYNFLIQNNSKLFGSEVSIIHNCEYLQINLEGQFYARSNNSMYLQFESGSHNLTIITNEDTRDFKIEIFPDRLEWEGDFLLLNQKETSEFISIDLSNNRENWASIVSIVIVWVLTTYVYWRLIESYVNKNFIEEVVK